jgi:hypothetical protein
MFLPHLLDVVSQVLKDLFGVFDFFSRLAYVCYEWLRSLQYISSKTKLTSDTPILFLNFFSKFLLFTKEAIKLRSSVPMITLITLITDLFTPSSESKTLLYVGLGIYGLLLR